jgi:DeoR family suf operon transcriptional repressor
MTTTGLPSTKQNILQALLKHAPAAASQLAQDLNLSPQAVRRHLHGTARHG